VRRVLPILVLLLAAGAANAAKPSAPVVDDGGWKYFLHSRARPASGVQFARIETTLSLTEPDAFELRTRATVDGPRSSEMAVVVAEFDPTLGESCVLVGDGTDRVPSDDPEGDESSAAPVFGEPDEQGMIPCSVVLPAGTDPVTVEVLVRRPRVGGLEDRFGFRLPVQPIGRSARTLVFSVESFVESEPTIQLLRWSTPLRKQVLEGGRLRVFYEIEGVQPRARRKGIRSLAGRVPEVVVTSGDLWDDVALDHRLQYLAAARATGPVIGMAGRVLGRGGGLASVREAARIALDEVALDPNGGRGGTWRLPQSAQYTLEEKVGTAADRAALLVSLLRTADVGAEIVLLSTDGDEPHPDRVVPSLDRTLVYVPNVKSADGRPLFIDPSRSSAWLGELDELLLGRSALLLAPEGVRWLRLPSELRVSSWSLRATEGEDGRFSVSVQGRLQGAAAARVREWERAGRPQDRLPLRDLVWAGAWASALEVAVSEGPAATILVKATGVLDPTAVVGGGTLAVPPLPTVIHGRPTGETLEILGADTEPFALELRESWRFRGRRSGRGSPSLKRTTPFWDVRSFASWTGPLFSRETTVRWTGRHLGPHAVGEDERFAARMAELFGTVERPAPAEAP
jgi:hypothetical protein